MEAIFKNCNKDLNIMRVTFCRPTFMGRKGDQVMIMTKQILNQLYLKSTFKGQINQVSLNMHTGQEDIDEGREGSNQNRE